MFNLLVVKGDVMNLLPTLCRSILITLALSTYASLSGLSVQQPLPTLKEYIDTLYTNINGFGISSTECECIRKEGGAPTYGEITYKSAEQLITDLKLGKKDVFYDLGCGVGKLVTQVFLSTPVKKSVGIELSQTRIEGAMKVAQQLKAERKITKKHFIEFLHKNITEANMHDATAVFMCSTCFSDDLMNKIVDKLLENRKKPLKLLSLRALPNPKKFTLEKTYLLPMTWSGGATVHLYTFKG